MESNHDIEMLEEGPYPYHLKQRVWSDKGHLSNKMSAEYLSNLIGDNTYAVILAIAHHNSGFYVGNARRFYGVCQNIGLFAA